MTGSRHKPHSRIENAPDIPRKAQKCVNMLFDVPVKNVYINQAISYMRHKANIKNIKRIEHCLYKNTYCSSKERDARLYPAQLRARQAVYISDELRKALLLHDWDSSIKLLLLILQTGTKGYSVAILKAFLVIIFNHPMTTPEMLTDFIRSTTGYMIDSDVEEFLLMIFTIRNTLLSPMKNGQYVRRQSSRKVTQDPSYMPSALDATTTLAQTLH